MGGSLPRPQPRAADRALLQTKLKRDELALRRRHLQRQTELAAATAAQLARGGQREAALYHLGKKRLLARDCLAVDARLTLLGRQISAVERLMDDAEVAAVLRQSGELIRELMERVDLADLRAADVGAHSAELTAAVRQELEDPDVLREYEALGAVDSQSMSAETQSLPREAQSLPAAAQPLPREAQSLSAEARLELA